MSSARATEPRESPSAVRPEAIDVDGPAPKRSRDESWWSDTTYIYCRVCHPDEGVCRNLPAGGRGGGGVTGRFAKSTSSTTKSAHMQRHKVAEQAAANSENQASGMRRLFHGRGAVTEADEAWAWAFLENNLAFSCADSASSSATTTVTKAISELDSPAEREMKQFEQQACDGGRCHVLHMLNFDMHGNIDAAGETPKRRRLEVLEEDLTRNVRCRPRVL
jgi:hypothetical protein